MEPLIIQDLVKDYSGNRALDGISITVEPGCRLGLLGPNGAGKTTLLSIITGELRPTSGSVAIGGVDPFRHRKRWRGLLGHLPQAFDFPPGVTGREVLLQAALLEGFAVSRAQEAVATLLEEFRFDQTIAARAAHGYSIGMKQRLAFACAIIADPALLLLDEPTAGLDPIERRLFRESLRDGLSHSQIAILSSHIVGDIEHCCDDVMVLGTGRVLFHGRVRDLAARAKSKVWSSPASESDLVRWKNEGRLISAYPENDRFVARVLSERQPNASATAVEAGLEDGYRMVMFEAGMEAVT